MVRTRSVYKVTGEQLSVLDIFRKPPTRKMKNASIMSADKQIATPSDLAAKVAALSDDMKTVLGWIKTQSAAPLAMPLEKSGRLAGTPPPKARVTPMKGAAEDISGVRDDDYSDDDGSIVPSVAEGRSKSFKVEAKIEIPNYDGIVDAKKLDAWLDQLETYVDLYNYSNAKKVTFAKLKFVGYALIWSKTTLQTFTNEEFTWSQFKLLIRQEFYPMGYKEERWKPGMSYAKGVTRQYRTTPPTSGVKPWRLASPLTIHRFFINTPRAYRSSSILSLWCS
uniref:Retrotransposon gag domain-containing protein n=1 Tax=Ananas comosus var. bracteatus TaxID=296719 RepID=A0A6V7PH03_ANACO|nr:unnamed protein product [Ananas comosus var. bracteatus]